MGLPAFLAAWGVHRLELPTTDQDHRYSTGTRTLRRSEEKRIEAFEIWIRRRLERVKWTDRIRNEAMLEGMGEERMTLKLNLKEKKELVGSLAGKKLSAEGCTGLNGEREKSSTRKKATIRSNMNCCQEVKRKIGIARKGLNRKKEHLLRTSGKRTKEETTEVLYEGVTYLLSKNLKVRIYKTVVLPVALYGCETWTLTLREEQRLGVLENKILRKIFGAKRYEENGESCMHCILHLTIRNSNSKRVRWAGHVARMGESRNPYRVLVGRAEGKRPLGRLRRRWEDNIKIELRVMAYDGREWINLAQDMDRWRAYSAFIALRSVALIETITMGVSAGETSSGSRKKGRSKYLVAQKRKNEKYGNPDPQLVQLKQKTKTVLAQQLHAYAHGKLNCADAASVPLHTIARMRLSIYGKCFLVARSNCRNKAQLTHGPVPTVNCPKIGLNLTSDTKKAPLMRQLGQEIMG
ncbi:hypothetical protein ANN_09607 [Periplaneta americana]|uniref:Uncharacterized protein n=1 Tax=Periplaneta americana TaxID=6978 RepID=A0ABQ8TQE0_PERAM|nr:hypothetical protein ANN_09607 [Periplaneta americana]